jgi:hypothetical protein
LPGGGEAVAKEGPIMKRILSAVVATVLLAAGAVGQSNSQPPSKSGEKPATETAPTPEQLLASAIKAQGGEAAIRKFSNRVMKGQFELPALNITGTAELYAAAPDRFYSLVRIPEYGDFMQAYDGKAAWSSDPNSGLRDISGEELAQFVRHSQFFHDLRFRELYPRQQVTGKAKVGERTAWVLEATAQGDAPESFYFDTETSLLLRHDAVQVTPEGKQNVEQYYEEYALVDGLKMPLRLRHVDANVTWSVTFAEVKHNVEIDPTRFQKPAAK